MDVSGTVRRLDLAPHPEGGWYRETWRAATTVPTPRGERSAGTSILYLLPAGGVSRLHRLAADEVWSLHAGGPLDLHLLEGDALRTLTLDADAPQRVVPAGTWFGAVARGAVLCGCAMAPGFDFADFELADPAAPPPVAPAHAALRDRLLHGKETP